jgi:NADH dehydrogenase/NADH:ubiquinone oxidoreductase subunit G
MVAAALLFSSCAGQPRPDDPSVRGIGYVRVDDVLKTHPLYPQLSQLQDAIAALNLQSLGANAVPRTPAQLAQQTRELNRELMRAQQQANTILAQKQQDYQRREQAAIQAALSAAGAGTNGSAAASQMQNVSAQQAQQVTSQANADFQAYQQSVIAQDNSAVARITQQFNDRENQAYRQRATQLQEQESQLSLELSQQDASKRLDLRMKLGNLALSDADRKQYRDALAALDRKESAQVDAQRRRDQQTLAAYQTQLRSQMSVQMAAAIAKIHDQTRSKLSSRHNEVTQQVASQLQGLQPQPVPSNLPQQTRDKIAQIDKQFKAQFQAEAQKTVQQYQQTKDDLDAQYAALQGANGAAAGMAGRQLAQLQRQRDDLYQKMVEQIKHDAGQVAAKRGLQVVFMNVEAAGGGIDLTDDVKKDIESLRQ